MTDGLLGAIRRWTGVAAAAGVALVFLVLIGIPQWIIRGGWRD